MREVQKPGRERESEYEAEWEGVKDLGRVPC